MPEAFPNVTSADLELPEAQWLPVPPIGPAIAVANTPHAEYTGLRLRGALAALGSRRTVRTSTVAVLLGSDPQLRRLAPIEQALGAHLRDAGFAMAISPGFSTWWSRTPFECLIAMARTAHFATQLAKSLPVVPTLVWRNDADLIRWAGWVTSTGATHVAVDLGTLRSPMLWEWGVRGVRLLDALLGGSPPRLVVNGPCTSDRLNTLRHAWSGEITFMAQRPWHLANTHHLLADSLTFERDDRPAAHLQVANARAFHRAAIATAGSRRDGVARAATRRAG